MKRRDFLIGASASVIAGPALLKAAVSPLSAMEVAPAGARVVSAAIFPPIGFSRVGNADDWFLAPEVPGLVSEPPGGFKQAADRVKKQVQRFRVYGFAASGWDPAEPLMAKSQLSTAHCPIRSPLPGESGRGWPRKLRRAKPGRCWKPSPTGVSPPR